MRYLLPILLLAACGPIPVQVSKTSQEQTQRQSAEQTASTAADQQSAHQSESKQGTNSMPVIVICNTNNSPSSRCVTQPEEAPVMEAVRGKVQRKIERPQ